MQVDSYSIYYLTPEGKRLKKLLYADSVFEARKEFQNTYPELVVTKIKHNNLGFLDKDYFTSNAYKYSFFESLTLHIEAGASATEALRSVIQSEENPSLRLEMDGALEIIDKGGYFSEAIRHVRFFDSTVLSILESGEKSGDLSSSIELAHQYLIDKSKNQKKVAALIGIAGFELSLAFSTFVGLEFSYLPMMFDQYSAGISDPDEIAAIQNTIDNASIVNWVFMSLFFFGLLVAGIFSFYKSMSKDKNIQTGWLARLPLISRFIEHQDLSTSFSVMHNILSNDAPIRTGLEVCLASSRSLPAKSGFKEIIERLNNGEELRTALEVDFFNKGEMMRIKSHRNKEQLSKIFKAVAGYRKELADRYYMRIAKSSFFLVILITLVAVAELMYILQSQESALKSLF